MKLQRIHHVEFWVGNAKQAAYYYRKAFGFSQLAYRGLESGSRDRASYVLAQGKARFVLTTPLTGDGPLGEHLRRHGDGPLGSNYVIGEVRWVHVADEVLRDGLPDDRAIEFIGRLGEAFYTRVGDGSLFEIPRPQEP